ncbi:MAG: 5-formyltetrahydrofolate cyclo-ligase [Candidatus Gastranaerophilaceae bacterium]
MQEKENLRKKAKEIRKSLDIEKISEKIVDSISRLEVYKKAQHVMIFYPLGHEVNLLGLLSKNGGKNFYLPKVKGKELLVCPYKTGDELTVSKFKTKEPTTPPVDSNIPDIIFVPALMADRSLNRLGYGGGFYDRFLSKKRSGTANSTKIVAIPSALVVDELPSESFDAKIDIVITER